MEDRRAAMDPELRLYNLHETGDALGVSYRTLLNWIKSGRLEARKVGSRWRVSEATIRALAKGEKSNPK